MYLNKLNDPLCCLFTFPKMCCSVQFWPSFPEQNNQTCEKKISAFTDTTIILFCWRRKYTEFFRNYSTLKTKVEIMRKYTAALEGRWLARGLTALQVVRTSFLGPRPRRFPPPPPAIAKSYTWRQMNSSFIIDCLIDKITYFFLLEQSFCFHSKL